MLRAGVLALLLPAASAARAEVVLSCSFPTLPPVVMTFPQGLDARKTMSVGGRPSVPLTEGQGTGRLISADVDGYHFRFSPQDSVMDVERDTVLVASETGSCVTIGGPVNDRPLQITAALAEGPPPEPAPSPAPATDRGNWLVTEDRSAFDDSRTVVLSLASDAPIRSQFGAPGPARLYLRCQENTTSLFLVLNDLFLADIQGFGAVDYRVDEAAAGAVQMTSSTDNKALGLWEGGKAIAFIKKLMAGKSVVFRATPYNDSPVEFSFTLAGLDAASLPLQEACGWQ